MALARVTIAGGLSHPVAREQISVPISLNIISPFIALFDFVWITLLGVAAGNVYHAVALDGAGDLSKHIGAGIAVATLYCALAHVSQLYLASNLVRIRWEVGRSFLVWLAVFVFLASLVFLLKIGADFSRGAVILFFTAGVVLNAAVRLFVARLCVFVIASGMIKPIRAVLIGVSDDKGSYDAVETLEAKGYAISGRLFLSLDEDQSAGDQEGAETRRRQRLREIVRHLRNRPIDEIFIAIPWHYHSLIEEIECELRALPLPVKLVPDNVTERLLRRPIFDLGQTKAVELQRAPLSGAQRKCKRIMDEVLAGLGLIVLAPFLAVVAIAVRLESPGPALFLQTRVGFNGRPFKIYKFRTMTTQDDGAVIRQATKNDKRVTRLGALLRRFSIDEIPQLINVVRGDMSLVGPRPHALAHDNEYDRLIATYAIRHKIKPGITGWAQVNGCRGETPEISMMKQRVENDIWYIEYWSIWLDIRILLLTIVRMVKPDNAY